MGGLLRGGERLSRCRLVRTLECLFLHARPFACHSETGLKRASLCYPTDFLQYFIQLVGDMGPSGYVAYAVVYAGLELLALPGASCVCANVNVFSSCQLLVPYSYLCLVSVLSFTVILPFHHSKMSII